MIAKRANDNLVAGNDQVVCRREINNFCVIAGQSRAGA
jgi:hypothetical protein